jgi:guanylate kinase
MGKDLAAMKNDGLLIILSGPSGTGKGTVLKALLAHDSNIQLSVSATTRLPRLGETDGKEYYFISREKFMQMAGTGQMLENAEYCGNCYGTPAEPIARWNAKGKDVILEIEVKGGAQVRKKRPDAVGIFILPPSMKELERRLRGRGTESDETVQRRMEAARREISQACNYDYTVVNDTVENAVKSIRSIITAEKCKACRNRQLIERML